MDAEAIGKEFPELFVARFLDEFLGVAAISALSRLEVADRAIGSGVVADRCCGPNGGITSVDEDHHLYGVYRVGVSCHFRVNDVARDLSQLRE